MVRELGRTRRSGAVDTEHVYQVLCEFIGYATHFSSFALVGIVFVVREQYVVGMFDHGDAAAAWSDNGVDAAVTD